MATLFQIFVGVMVLAVHVKALPSHLSDLEEFIKINNDEMKISESELAGDKTNARQKRWYNIYGYGFPPINPIVYPNNIKRDESRETGVYGLADPFSQIHTRLQEISSAVKQQAFAPPPPAPQFPILFPVIYVPQIGGCSCTPTTSNNKAPDDKKKPTVPNGNNNETLPTINNRTPDMEDPRQNWGFVVNKTDEDDGNDEDFSRPISFTPILPSRPISRPSPPVEHGSTQADINVQNTVSNEPAVESQSELETGIVLTDCDIAVLVCCHRAQVTYDCFTQQGCPDTTPLGDPCAANAVLKVVGKYTKFYEQKYS